MKGREDWNYADWERKDPDGLLAMKTKSPEMFADLEATIGQKPTIESN